ncbi:MAG: potassium channel protein [Candidatus Latescibacterota bacterium]
MSLYRRFTLSVVLLTVLPLFGTVGYMRLEGWDFRQSFYMSIVTMSTVGFREMGVLSPTGEWFTIVYILLSITFVGFAAATVTAFVVQGELAGMMKGRRMQRQIEKLESHYILCGCGAVGREIALEFHRAGVEFVVVERDPHEGMLPRDLEVLQVQGDATDEEVLEMAGIRRAKGLVAALHNDPENVFVTLTARQLNPALWIVARASEKGTEAKLLRAGADRVISPFEIAGRRMASTVLRPHVVNFLDVITHGSGADMRLEEVHVDPSSTLVGKSLRECDLGRRTRAVIVAIHDSEGRPRTGPDSHTTLAEMPLQAGDILIALGSDEQIRRLKLVAQI